MNDAYLDINVDNEFDGVDEGFLEQGAGGGITDSEVTGP